MNHDVFYTYIPFAFAKIRIDMDRSHNIAYVFGGILRDSCLSRLEHVWPVGRTSCIETGNKTANMRLSYSIVGV